MKERNLERLLEVVTLANYFHQLKEDGSFLFAEVNKLSEGRIRELIGIFSNPNRKGVLNNIRLGILQKLRKGIVLDTNDIKAYETVLVNTYQYQSKKHSGNLAFVILYVFFIDQSITYVLSYLKGVGNALVEDLDVEYKGRIACRLIDFNGVDYYGADEVRLILYNGQHRDLEAATQLCVKITSTGATASVLNWRENGVLDELALMTSDELISYATLIQFFNDYVGLILDDTLEFNSSLGRHSNTSVRKVHVHTDSALGVEDHLNIADDVKAFAVILASKQVSAPLAIALLGNWGSGKSFFMRKIQQYTKELSEHQGFVFGAQTASKRPSSSLGLFCKGIAQIEFNAWSYVDTNLWASLIVKIFEELKQYLRNQRLGEEYTQLIEQDIVRKLRFNRSRIKAIEKEKETLVMQIEALNQQCKSLELALSNEIDSIRQFSFEKQLDQLHANFNLKEIIQRLSKEGKEYESILSFLRSVPDSFDNDVAGLLHTLRSKGELRRQFFRNEHVYPTLIGLIALIGLFILLQQLVLSTLFPNLLVSLVTLVGALYARINALSKKILPVIQVLRKELVHYKRSVDSVIRKKDQEEKAIQIRMELLKRELEIAKANVLEKERNVGKLEFKLNHALSTEALQHLILEKANGTEYKKHLGIISEIRKDFEILSELLPKHHLEIERLKHIEGYKPLERIILYIDDLDRCSEQKVMEVLEAVHLLLAYPLFMVVVGVDKRSVTNALIYKSHLPYIEKTGIINVEELNNELDIDLTQPEEYLEKIFQIPFQLKSPLPEAYAQLIDAIVKSEGKKEGSEGNTLQEKRILKEESMVDYNTLDLKEVKKYTYYASEAEAFFQVVEPRELVLDEVETNALKAFAWMIGNTPRRIKRFVNIYKVIRAHPKLDKAVQDMPELRYLIIFYLSWGIGEYIACAEKFYERIEGAKSESMKEIIEAFVNHEKSNDGIDLLRQKFLSEFKEEDQWHIIASSIHKMKVLDTLEVYNFVRRFSFL